MAEKTAPQRRLEDDVFGVRLEEVLTEGRKAIADGHCFDLGRVAQRSDLIARQPSQDLLPSLVVPYATTAISIMFGDAPQLLVLRSDDRGRLTEILSVALLEHPFSRRSFVAAQGLVGIHRLPGSDAPAPIIHVDADPLETRMAHHYAWQAWTLLSLINDDRLQLRRELAPDKLNKARVKAGKPPLPDLWRLDLGETLYVTKLAPYDTKRGGRRGGSHASPTPHARRAHFRRLPSGRTIFVRDCRVNAIRHLRKRDHYAINANPGGGL